MKKKQLIKKTASVALATGAVVGGAALVNTTSVKAATQADEDLNGKLNDATQDLDNKNAVAEGAKQKLDDANSKKQAADKLASQADSNLDKAKQANDTAQKLAEEAKDPAKVKAAGDAVDSAKETQTESESKQTKAGEAQTTAENDLSAAQKAAKQANDHASSLQDKADQTAKDLAKAQTEFNNSKSGQAKNAADKADEEAKQAAADLTNAQKADEEAAKAIPAAQGKLTTAQANQQKANAALADAKADQAAKHATADNDQKAANAQQDKATAAQQNANDLKKQADDFVSDATQKAKDAAQEKADKAATAKKDAEDAVKDEPAKVQKAENDLAAANQKQDDIADQLSAAVQEQTERRNQANSDAAAVDEQKQTVAGLDDKYQDAAKKANDAKNDTSYQGAADAADQKVDDLTTKRDAQDNQVGVDQGNIDTLNSKLTDAQNQSDDLAQEAADAHQAVENNKADQDTQKANIEKGESLTQNRIILSDAYKQAVADYQNAMNQIYQDAYNNALADPTQYLDNDTGKVLTSEKYAAIKGQNAVIDEALKEDKSAINQSFYNAMSRAGQDMIANMDRDNPYKSSEIDQRRQIDLDHITTEQSQELNEYALRLLNDVRTQLGLTPLVLNGDVEQMAQDIADQYTADGRTIEDEGHHDANAVCGVAANEYHLNVGSEGPWPKENGDQPFEQMGGNDVNTHIIIEPNSDEDSSLVFKLTYNNDSNSHLTTMDDAKQGIYLNIAQMLLDDARGGNNWGHTTGLLNIGAKKDYMSLSHAEYKFGFAINILPGHRDYSGHYIIVSTRYIKKDSLVSSDTNRSVSSMDDEITNLQNAQEQLADDQNNLRDLEQAANDADQAVQDNQNTIDEINDQLTDAQTQLDADQATLDDLNNQLSGAQSEQTAAHNDLDSHNAHVKSLQADADQAQQNLDSANEELDSLQHTAAVSLQGANDQDDVVNGLNQQKQDAIKAVAKAKQDKQDAITAKTQAERNLADLTSANQAAQTALHQAKQALQDYQTTLAQKQGAAQTAQTTATAEQKEADRLAGIAKNSATLATQADQNVAAKQKTKDEADAAVTTADKELQQATVHKTATAAALTNAQTADTAAKAVKEQAHKNLQQYQTDLQDKEAKLNAAKSANDIAQAAAQQAQKQADDANKAVAEAQTKLDQAKDIKKQADHAVDQAKKAVADAEQHVQDLQNAPAKVEEAKAALDKAQKAVDDAKQAQKVADDAVTAAQTAYNKAKADVDTAQNVVNQLTAQKREQDERNYFNDIVDNTINNLSTPAVNTASATNNSEATNNITSSATSSQTKSNEETAPAKTKPSKKVETYYTLNKKSRVLRKLKRNHTVKYRHTAVLRGKKNLHFVKITKHNRVYKILRKMKHAKKYQVLAIKHIGGRYYAQVKLGKHKTAWINIKYIKFLRK